MKAIIAVISILSQIIVYGQSPNFLLFSSLGHPKAAGLDFTIKYPTSWNAQEGNRPHIVQKFLDPSKEDLASFLVLIRKADIPISKAEIESELSLQNLKKYAPPDAKYISGQNKLLIDGQKAASIDFIHSRLAESTPIGKDIQFYMRTYIIFWKNYMVQIQCSVGQEGIDDDILLNRFAKYKTLFALTANSFVLNSRWE